MVPALRTKWTMKLGPYARYMDHSPFEGSGSPQGVRMLHELVVHVQAPQYSAAFPMSSVLWASFIVVGLFFYGSHFVYGT